jgi:hypothetical protein
MYILQGDFFIFSRLNLNTLRTQPLRADKHCLNCGSEVPERFCTHCGQENTERHETFTHLVQHFVADFLHYDSQFLKTLKYLLFRPGKLTTEYMAGRRVSYVNPIKLYIFISFVFFLIYAFMNPVSHGGESHKPAEGPSASEKLTPAAVADSLQRALKREGIGMQLSEEDSAELAEAKNDSTGSELYKSLHEYDSIQASLPASERAGFWKRLTIRRLLYFKDKGDTKASFGELFQHNMPKMMFILLPLFALLMKFLYRKKQWFYADHAIFSLHVHSFAFVLLLITFILDHYVRIGKTYLFTRWGVLAIMLYIVLALYFTYRQSFIKSTVKAFLLLFSYSFLMMLVFSGFVFLAFAVFL